MSINSIYDIFDSEILKNVEWCGEYDFPKLKPCHARPTNLVSFDHKHEGVKKPNSWLHFYVHDKRFRNVLTTPEKYLGVFKTFEGLIGTDRSVYRDLPKVEQVHHVFSNRLMDAYLQQNGIEVIPNISWADFKSFPWCCDGVEPESTVAVSSLGAVKNRVDRFKFIEGFFAMADILRPDCVVYYGAVPSDVMRCAKEKDFLLMPFESRIFAAHKNRR